MSYESMDYRKYTQKSEFDKAINSLEGILKGIALDKSVNVDEIKELKNWCLLNNQFLDKNPFNEVISLVELSIEDEELTKEEVQDILWVCSKFKSNSKFYDMITSDIQKLQGYLHGVLADNDINEKEAFGLNEWLNSNEHLANIYPYDEVYSLLLSVLSDGKLDEKEKDILKVFFSEFIDVSKSQNININEINKLKEEIKISGICTICPDITIKDKMFCFTGISSKTNRDNIQNIIESLNGRYNDNITRETNYLVVGNNNNPCWAYACYGRKIEKAMELRKKGNRILIIHENDFWDEVEDAKVEQERIG